MPLLVTLVLSLMLQAKPDISGAWAITVVDFGLPNTMRLVLKQDGNTLTGTLGNQALEGTLAGADFTFKVGNREAKGKLRDGRLAGQVMQGGRTSEWSAERLPQRPATPRTHRFDPTNSSCISPHVSTRSSAWREHHPAVRQSRTARRVADPSAT
jgi:hypothetical protein